MHNSLSGCEGRVPELTVTLLVVVSSLLSLLDLQVCHNTYGILLPQFPIWSYIALTAYPVVGIPYLWRVSFRLCEVLFISGQYEYGTRSAEIIEFHHPSHVYQSPVVCNLCGMVVFMKVSKVPLERNGDESTHWLLNSDELAQQYWWCLSVDQSEDEFALVCGNVDEGLFIYGVWIG